MEKKRKITILILVATFLAFGNIFAQETTKEAFEKGIEHFKFKPALLWNIF